MTQTKVILHPNDDTTSGASKKNSTASAYGGARVKDRLYDSDAWSTPDGLYTWLDDIFHFTIDLAASAENTKSKRFFSKEDDALTKSWKSERGFLNCPFSLTDQFLEKTYAETRKRGGFVVCLIKADTSTKWWHKWWREAELLDFLNRIQFVPPPGMPLTKFVENKKNGQLKEVSTIGSPNMGHAILGFGDFSQVEKLVKRQSQLGFGAGIDLRF